MLSLRTKDDPEVVKARYAKWSTFAGFLRESKEKVFWANSTLNIANLYEDVVHEFEKRFIWSYILAASINPTIYWSPYLSYIHAVYSDFSFW